MRLVFPNKEPKEIKILLKSSYDALSRFIIDSARFDTLSEEWYRTHIECPFNEQYKAIKAKNPNKGILVASSHLGSIELQAFMAPIGGRTFSFVVRNFKWKILDEWWTKRRERLGNKVIPRKGAYQKILGNLSTGRDVAILIDQNVTKRNALFVDWFGREAATTFALGLAAVETGAPVVVSAITYIGNDHYKVIEHECDISQIIENPNFSKNEKVLQITQLVANEIQKLILSHPSEWFWMHRRWKTTRDNKPEDFYTQKKTLNENS